MNAKEAIEYIHSVSWMGSRPGLGRTRKLLSLMGDPQNKLKFVHVAGTNGKGSVCAMLASILQSQGYRVGLYTSPYIISFNERIKVNGIDIPDEKLAEVTEYVKSFAESMEEHPTEFELVTAIGFEHFYRENCDVVVLEVGLGGELDSTNVIEAPLVSVITEIGLDHMGVLGNSVESIAYAKAGIIKTGSIAVSANNTTASARVINAVCAERGCACITPDFQSIQNARPHKDGVSFTYKGVDYDVPLLGEYQLRNALMAITAIKALNLAGLPVDEESVTEGLRRVSWRGRFEKLCDSPLFYYDGGHNPQGVSAAVETYKARCGNQRCIVLMGVMADKDYGKEINMLKEIADAFVAVTPDNPRALSSVRLSDDIAEKGAKAIAAKSVEDGVALAGALAGDNAPILAIGSLYMYCEVFGAVEKLFLQKQGQ